MGRYYWLSLLSFIALLVLGGRARHFVQPEIVAMSCSQEDQLHPFLCGKKIKISHAHISDLSTIDGVSHKKARAIYEFYKQNPHLSLEMATDVSGVGPKTLEKLLVRFY